jgi:outer membrane receptor protein involved in Fe transport
LPTTYSGKLNIDETTVGNFSIHVGPDASLTLSGTISGTGAAGSVSRDSVAITIRGFNTRSFLRSGFRQDTVTDVINLDRLEVARGPQALLYGVASLGGIVALTPKYPRANQRTEARLGYGSDDFVRAEIYNTGPIWKPKNDTRYLNYGVGLVYQNQSSRSDFDDRERLLGADKIVEDTSQLAALLAL